jgi:hypothetical protein
MDVALEDADYGEPGLCPMHDAGKSYVPGMLLALVAVSRMQDNLANVRRHDLSAEVPPKI